MICNNFCNRLRKQWNFWLSLRALEEQSWTWMRSTCGSWWIMGRIWRPSERRTRSTRLSPWFPGTCPQWPAESPGQDSYTGRLNTQWKYSRPSPRFWRFVFGVLMMKIWHVFNFDNLLQILNALFWIAASRGKENCEELQQNGWSFVGVWGKKNKHKMPFPLHKNTFINYVISCNKFIDLVMYLKNNWNVWKLSDAVSQRLVQGCGGC